MLVGLEVKALKELVFDQVHFLVELFVETGPVSFFALFQADTMLNADTNEVDSGKGTVAATSNDTIGFWEAR